jgi:hypothetical protein
MRPLDPMAGAVERFACELRALRAAAGELPFWKMARRCEMSKSALAAAVAGYELPSERVTQEFVHVCGGDWPWWRARLAQARAQLEAAVGMPLPAAEGDPPLVATGAELVLAHRVPPVRAMARAELATRTAFPPALPVPPTGRRTTRPRRTVTLFASAAVVLTGTGVLIAHYMTGRPAITIAPSPPSAAGAYDQTVGPGCPHTAMASITQDDFTENHKWNQTAAADWNVPDCSNLIETSAPTASSDPARWQDDYEWYFDNVPKTAQCTFHIYIPDSPDARYTAAYDWTAGDSSYLDSTAFVIDQAAYHGQWFNQGPHVFSTGQAMMMITDARSNAPDATLTAAVVRLTCR